MNQIESETYNNATAFVEHQTKPYLGNVGRLYERLLAVSQLKQGWDGYNAQPVNRQVIQYARRIGQLRQHTVARVADFPGN